MATIQTFYLRTTANSSALDGTTSLSGVTPNASATGASTTRTLSSSLGSNNGLNAAVSTAASTSAQRNWFARYISSPLAAQTISSGTWTFSLGANESNANSNFVPTAAVYVWRPTTTATVGTIVALGSPTTISSGTMSTTASIMSQSLTGSSLTIQDGDVLVVELWGCNTQSMATSYTNTSYYDGNSNTIANSYSSNILAPAALTLSSGGAAAYPAAALIFGC